MDAPLLFVLSHNVERDSRSLRNVQYGLHLWEGQTPLSVREDSVGYLCASPVEQQGLSPVEPSRLSRFPAFKLSRVKAPSRIKRRHSQWRRSYSIGMHILHKNTKLLAIKFYSVITV